MSSEAVGSKRLQVCTLVSVFVLGIGGWIGNSYRFHVIDKRMAVADEREKASRAELNEHDLLNAKQQLLQMDGRIVDDSLLSSVNPVRHLGLVVHFQNAGRSPIHLGSVHVRTLKRSLDADVAAILPPNVGLTFAAHHDHRSWPSVRRGSGRIFYTEEVPRGSAYVSPEEVPQPKEESDIPEPAETVQGDIPMPIAPVPTKVAHLNLYSGDWMEEDSFAFDPTIVGGSDDAGIILPGQIRSLSFDVFTNDGTVPELLKIEITAHPGNSTKQTWSKQTCVTCVGCGPLKSLFANTGTIVTPTCYKRTE